MSKDNMGLWPLTHGVDTTTSDVGSFVAHDSEILKQPEFYMKKDTN